MPFSEPLLDLGNATARILDGRQRIFAAHALLVRKIQPAVNVDDGRIQPAVTQHLGQLRAEVALAAAVDAAHRHIRFDPARPAENFYRNAIRFEEMFEKLVLPLKARRSLRLEADFAEETATAYRRHVYEYTDVDVILLEGIYLLRRDLRRHYDVAVWIECSFETALERAIRRGQEGLPPAETIRAYQSIFFPAQQLHFALDEPWAAADLVLHNDPLLVVPDGPASSWFLPARPATLALEMT